MIRAGSWVGMLAAFASLFGGCGSDPIAGKTTTTTNGGGVVAVSLDGHPIAGVVVFAARSWDPVTGTWGEVDTLRGDSAGHVLLPVDRYAFLELRDRANVLGAWAKGVIVSDGATRVWVLDTLRSVRGRWADRAGVGPGRLFLDSSFRSVALDDSGGRFDFGAIPVGSYEMLLAPQGQPRRFMGVVQLESTDRRYLGSGNILLDHDTTGSPLWIEDFESDPPGVLLRRSFPQVAGWYVWSTLMTVSQPSSSSDSSMHKAIGPDSLRPTNAYHSRFVATDPFATIGLGLTRLHFDVSARELFCFQYRSDTTVTVQFQRDSVGGVRPSTSATLSSSLVWRDACVATSSFVPGADTPDSLKTWTAFGRSILTLEFHVPAGGTFLDLDDIRMR